jgi:hypothetical protein
MKTYSISLILTLTISCTSIQYEINFQNIDFPEKLINTDSKNSNFYSESNLSKATNCKTELAIYNFGEVIQLTIKNSTKDTVYFFPDEQESNGKDQNYQYRDSLSTPKIDDLKKELISENPAIKGVIHHESASLSILEIYSINQITASKLGYNTFHTPLPPGKTMTFNVKMPNESGHYRFFIQKFDHNINDDNVLWGIHRYYVSNSFEIVKN